MARKYTDTISIGGTLYFESSDGKVARADVVKKELKRKKKLARLSASIPTGRGKKSNGTRRLDFDGWSRDSKGRLRKHGKMVKSSVNKHAVKGTQVTLEI